MTHYKKFNAEAQPILADFYGTVREGLREKLGPVLFQLPPKAAYPDELAQRLVASLDPAFTNVVEFRCPSWWAAEPQRLLTRHGIAFAGPSYPPPLELPDEVVAHTSVLCYRFHGVPGLCKSSYQLDFLARVAAGARAAPHVRQVHLYLQQRYRRGGRAQCPADAGAAGPLARLGRAPAVTSGGYPATN